MATKQILPWLCHFTDFTPILNEESTCILSRTLIHPEDPDRLGWLRRTFRVVVTEDGHVMMYTQFNRHIFRSAVEEHDIPRIRHSTHKHFKLYK